MEPESTVERRQGEGRIFVTENERLSERYPSFSGYAELDGIRYDVALWKGTKPTRDGKPYVSGTIIPSAKKR